MRKRLYLWLLVAAVALSTVAVLRIQARRAAARSASAATITITASADLLNQLPASDAVVFLDAQRALSEVLPRLTTNDAALLTRINRKIEQLKERTGADLQQLDRVALGISFKNHQQSRPDRVTVLARGRFDASTVIAEGLAKEKARRDFKPTEQVYEGKTIYILGASGNKDSVACALDANTIAFGDLDGVRAAINVSVGRGERVSSSLIELATLNANAVVGFSANVPASAVGPAARDEFSRAFSSVRQVYGALSLTGTTGEAFVALRAETTAQAQDLGEKLVAFKQLGSLFVSQEAKDNNPRQGDVLASEPNYELPGGHALHLPFPPSWIKEINITTVGNEVQIKTERPLTDLARFVPRF
jgi:acetylornithine deacetylase/succinyl-diaminopimelate desuccinylase-like protein